MSHTENSSTQGLFTYNMTFKATLVSGIRNNFMPWHRKPVDSNGVPVSASIPTEGPRPDELNVPYSNDNTIAYPNRDPNLVVESLDKIRSSILEDQSIPIEDAIPLRPVSRREQ